MLTNRKSFKLLTIYINTGNKSRVEADAVLAAAEVAAARVEAEAAALAADARAVRVANAEAVRVANAC